MDDDVIAASNTSNLWAHKHSNSSLHSPRDRWIEFALKYFHLQGESSSEGGNDGRA